ncbi:hypothetical protein [Bacillus glycinifermentans]|uniref:hypothetical protein n=2 Tax=Bacillaceae TaxID=186817 RepID=UPI001F32B8C9|nr:hypothetical protein [Bacillus glycinifermentans]
MKGKSVIKGIGLYLLAFWLVIGMLIPFSPVEAKQINKPEVTSHVYKGLKD